MSRYAVTFLETAKTAVRETVAYITDQDGVEAAERWKQALLSGAKALETLPLGFPESGPCRGRILRSKVVMSHRFYYFVDEPEKRVAIIDVVHTHHETRLQEYRKSPK